MSDLAKTAEAPATAPLMPASGAAAVATPVPAAAAPAPAPATPVPVSPWSLLKVEAFRALWLAYLISLVGTWAREAGGPWLMRALKEGSKDAAYWVSLIQTAGTLPICLLSIAAGVLADIYDRRRLLIGTNLWMLVISALLGAVTLYGWATPHVLLAFTLLLGVGAALAGPAFQYVIPELVPPAQLGSAVALNSVALNVARAAGPVLGMLIVMGVGHWTDHVRAIGASFVVNAAAFVGVIWVLARWHRGAQKPPAHPETPWSATVTAFKYTIHSAPLRAILVRVAAFILCAVVVWAQLPIMARQQLHGGEWTYLLLMGTVGVGAVIGVVFMPRMERRFSTEGMVSICTAIFGLALMGLSLCRGPMANIWFAGGLAMVVGFNWVIVPTNFNIATQKSVPNWVKGRAIAMYMTVLFGSFAVGSPIWGRVASSIGVEGAELIAGSLVVAGVLLAKVFPLTRARGLDFSPAGLPAPVLATEMEDAGGPITAAVRYHVEPARAREFVREARRGLAPQRLRNGATGWHLARLGLPPSQAPGAAPAGAVVFEERFGFRSWKDRLRHHARTTKADWAVEQRVRALHTGAEPPEVRYERGTVMRPAGDLGLGDLHGAPGTPGPARGSADAVRGIDVLRESLIGGRPGSGSSTGNGAAPASNTPPRPAAGWAAIPERLVEEFALFRVRCRARPPRDRD